MKKHSLLFLSLFLILILALLNYVAFVFHLYFTVWWFDILMHFLAGFAGGFFIVWLVLDSGLVPHYFRTTFWTFFLSALALLVIGVAWEVFEYYIRNYVNFYEPAFESITLDTTYDLVLDVLGAVFATIIGIRRPFRFLEEENSTSPPQ